MSSPSPTDRGRNSMIGNASMGASVSGSRRGSLGMTSVKMLTDQDRRGSININTNTSNSPSPSSIESSSDSAASSIRSRLSPLLPPQQQEPISNTSALHTLFPQDDLIDEFASLETYDMHQQTQGTHDLYKVQSDFPSYPPKGVTEKYTKSSEALTEEFSDVRSEVPVRIPEPGRELHDPPTGQLSDVLLKSRGILEDLDLWLVSEDNSWNGNSESEEEKAVSSTFKTNISALSDQLRQSFLGPAPSPISWGHGRSVEKGGEKGLRGSIDSASGALISMKAMKHQVDTALHELAIMRRNEVLSWEANDSLRISAKVARKSSMRKMDQGLSRLGIYRTKVQDLRVDKNKAQEWTGFVQTILAEIEVR